jgi:hypothetical protein
MGWTKVPGSGGQPGRQKSITTPVCRTGVGVADIVVPLLQDEASLVGCLSLQARRRSLPRSNLSAGLESDRNRSGPPGDRDSRSAHRGPEQSEESGHAQDTATEGAASSPAASFRSTDFRAELAASADDAGTARPVGISQSGAEHDRSPRHVIWIRCMVHAALQHTLDRERPLGGMLPAPRARRFASVLNSGVSRQRCPRP